MLVSVVKKDSRLGPEFLTVNEFVCTHGKIQPIDREVEEMRNDIIKILAGLFGRRAKVHVVVEICPQCKMLWSEHPEANGDYECHQFIPVRIR